MATDELPQDVPWRRLTVGANLSEVTDTSQPSNSVQVQETITGLVPSLAVFQYVAPETSDSVLDSSAYPESRVVLLRAASSLTGMQLVTSLQIFGVALNIKDYLPCIGAVLTISVDCPEFDDRRYAPLYIRDCFPKKQEMILNEVLGTQTMEREVERHSVTRNWNVSAGFNFQGFTAGGGASTTEVDEAQNEKSSTESHTINVSHVHHVLTAYHLGSRRATLTIQPRPYEGEEWELLGGPRRVEGIQDFVVLVNVPASASKLEVKACLTIGFLGHVSGGNLPPEPADPLQIADAFQAAANDMLSELLAKSVAKSAEKIETWEKWVDRYQRWIQIREFVRQLNTKTRVLTAQLCAHGTIDLTNPDRPVMGTALPPRFLDASLENFISSTLATPAAAMSARSLANYFAARSFHAVMQLSSGEGDRLSTTEYSRLTQWQKLVELPSDHQLMDAAIQDLTSVSRPDRELLAASNIRTLRDLIAAVSQVDSSAQIGALRAVGTRIFAPRQEVSEDPAD